MTTSTVAALLTILGYSLYDTIIVFDRIRENVPRMPRATFSQIVEPLDVGGAHAVAGHQLLDAACRSAALMLFGGETLKDFGFALLVGVASGAYSSIFIATPVLVRVEGARARLHAPPPAGSCMEDHGGDMPALRRRGTLASAPARSATARRAPARPRRAGAARPRARRRRRERARAAGRGDGRRAPDARRRRGPAGRRARRRALRRAAASRACARGTPRATRGDGAPADGAPTRGSARGDGARASAAPRRSRPPKPSAKRSSGRKKHGRR